MPTKQVVIAVGGTKIVDPDSQRTCLTLFNTDNANIIYFTDEPGKAVGDMCPVFPETFISLERNAGEEPQKAWYGRTAVQSTLAVLESFGEIAPVQPDTEPNPQEPFSPLDAPKMKTWWHR